MKKLSFIAMSMILSMPSFSQTIGENIEKLSKDPKTAENAGKADVYTVANKKIIADTAIAPHLSSCRKKNAAVSRKKNHFATK